MFFDPVHKRRNSGPDVGDADGAQPRPGSYANNGSIGYQRSAAVTLKK